MARKTKEKIAIDTETTNQNINGLIPKDTIDKPVIENKISKADLVNIITQGVKNTANKKLDDINYQLEKVTQEFNLLLKEVEKEFNKEALIKEYKITHSQFVSDRATFTLKINITEKVEINDSIYYDYSATIAQKRKELDIRNTELNREAYRLKNAIERTCSNNAVKAQIDSAVIAKTANGSDFMNNINEHIKTLSDSIFSNVKQLGASIKQLNS